MKRTALARRTPLRTGKSMERTGKLPPVNKKRAAKRFREAFHSTAFVEWVQSLGCSVPECGRTDIEVCHATSRGAGGRWEDCLSLCSHHHEMQHRMGVRSFERHVGFTLADVASATALRWRAFAK